MSLLPDLIEVQRQAEKAAYNHPDAITARAKEAYRQDMEVRRRIAIAPAIQRASAAFRMAREASLEAAMKEDFRQFAAVSLETATALIAHFGSPDCSVPHKLAALQAINTFASANGIRHEDAITVLTAQLGVLKNVCDTKAFRPQRRHRPLPDVELNRVIEEATAVAGALFDAEEARQQAVLAAEKAANELLWKKQQEEARARQEADIRGRLAGKEHNFTKIGEPHFVKHGTTFHMYMDGTTPAGTFKIPDTWATQYAEKRIPFLPMCPVCSKGNTISCRVEGHGFGGITYRSDIVEVKCADHYKWDPATGQHYKHMPYVPPTYTRLTDGSLWPPPPPAHMAVGGWKVWDPTDPDGSIAAKALREKEAADLESQVKILQERIVGLRSA
jgi:hypothetical protein